jgi:hypothetical protein
MLAGEPLIPDLEEGRQKVKPNLWKNKEPVKKVIFDGID